MDRLSVLTRLCLHRAGIDTIKELKETTCDDLMRVRNLGKRGMDEIMKIKEVEENEKL